MSTIVKLPINKEIEFALSAGNYNSVTTELLCHLDILYTYFFRYPRLFAVDIAGSSTSQGVSIDFTDSHPAAAICTTIVFGGIAVAGAVSLYQQKKKEHAAKLRNAQYQNSSVQVQAQLKEAKTEASLIVPTYHNAVTNKVEPTLYTVAAKDQAICEQVAKEDHKQKLNNALAQLLSEDEVLKKKYKSIQFSDQHIEVTLQDEKKSTVVEKAFDKAKSFAKASWVTMGICSFVYWILWISAGVITGNFDVGIKALGAAAFAVPAAVAVIYPAIKTHKWWKKYFGPTVKNTKGDEVKVTEDIKTALSAAHDLTRLMRKLGYQNEETRLKAELAAAGEKIPESETKAKHVVLEDDHLTLSLRKNKWNKKTIAEFFETTIRSYIGSQYIAWITVDFLKVAFGVTLNLAGAVLGLGVVALAGSVVHGAYQAYKKHQDIKKMQAETDAIVKGFSAKQDTIENVYRGKKATIETLAKEIVAKNPARQAWVDAQLKSFNGAMTLAVEPVEQKKVPFYKEMFSSVYAFANGITGGAMIGRGLLLVGTFTLPILVVGLANPYTIGIIVALGLVWGAFKAYQHHQAVKEKRAKAILENRQERVESLQKQVDLADLQIALLQAKAEEATAPLTISTVKPEIDPSIDKTRSPSPTSPSEVVTPLMCSSRMGMFQHSVLKDPEVAGEEGLESGIKARLLAHKTSSLSDAEIVEPNGLTA